MTSDATGLAGTLPSYAADARVRGSAPVFAVAWRNIWRNSRRTWLTVAGIAFAVVLLVFGRSTQIGTFSAMVDTMARMSTGHMQVQHPEYQENPRLEHLVDDADAIVAALRADPAVRYASARLQASALASVDQRSFGAMVVGVEAVEAQWSGIAGVVSAGRFIEGPGESFVGATLARNLGAQVGDELVLLGTAHEGGVAALVTTIVGTFSSGSTALDRAMVQVALDDFRVGWDLPEGVAHQILVLSPTASVSEPLAQRFTWPGMVTLSWPDLLPEAVQTIEMKRVSTYMLFAVIGIIVVFSVVNTFMITVFERTPEFGMMMAIGMRPRQIIGLLQLEALWLCLLGLAVGLGISGGLVLALASSGIPMPDVTEQLASEMMIPDRLYPEFGTTAALIASVAMLVGTQFAALVPGLKIAGMKPVEAVRAET